MSLGSPPFTPPKAKLRKILHLSSSTEHYVNIASVKENAKSAWHGFKLASKNVEKFLDGTPFKIPVGVINALIALVDAVIDNHDSMAILLLPIGQRLQIVSTNLRQRRRPYGINSTCQRFIQVLMDTVKELEEIKGQGLFKRIFESGEQPKQLKDIFRRVDEATKNFELELTLATVREVEGIVQNTEILRLENLKPSHEARYSAVSREPCVEGTREAIIETVLSWCKDSNSPPIFWLSGMAGTGKSTIAYTICQRLYDDGAARRLGASFFCSRQIEAARIRKKLIPTLVYDLAHGFPAFGRALLASKFDAQPPPLKDHIQSLLSAPWRSISANRSLPPLVIVIDALDELERGEGSAFLEDLIKEITVHPDGFRGLKFFVTSRQDPHIVDVCAAIDSGAVCRLEEVPSDVVENDINLYLRRALPALDESPLRILASQASGLFIYAATAVRFIVPLSSSMPSVPTQKKRLETLVNAWPRKSQCTIDGLLVDRLYEEILATWLHSMAEDDQTNALSVLQTVICTEEPILISDIPQLLHNPDLLEPEEALTLIQSLHAILYVARNKAYSYHKSFIDFMFDRTRFADPSLAEKVCPTPQRQTCLSTRCFRIMESLRFNICNLPSSYLDDSEVQDLPERIDKNIPTALRYTCRHWATHVSKTPSDNRESLVDMFWDMLDQRLLFWLEAMNLLKSSGDCYPLLVKARQSVGMNITMDNMKNLTEAENLATIFSGNIISNSTPHLYISALASSPHKSSLMMRWCARFRKIPAVTTLFSHGAVSPLLSHRSLSYVLSASFSPDGRHIVCGLLDNTVNIWDASTGEQIRQLDGHRGRVGPVSFSPNGTQVVSGSKDNVMHLWDVSTGKHIHQLSGCGKVSSLSFLQDGTCIVAGSAGNNVIVWNMTAEKQMHELKGHHERVLSIASSLDGNYVVSGSEDCTVCIWGALTGKQIHRLGGHRGPVWSVCFSLDGTRTLSGSEDNIIHVWDVSTGKQIHRLDGHHGPIWSVVFSLDGTHLVSGSEDGTVHIWDALAGKQIHQLDGHHGPVWFISLSSDGARIISASDDETVRLWDVPTGKQTSQIDLRDEAADLWGEGLVDAVQSVSFSPDGTRFMSGKGGTINIWDASGGTRGRQVHKLDGHNGIVLSASFSPDMTCVISSSDDGTVRVWDSSTGKQIHKLDGHGVRPVNFSPDGTHIVTGSRDGIVHIWDLSTGNLVHHLDGHSAMVLFVDFSPDGAHVVSASEDNTVCVWDTLTGKQTQRTDKYRGQAHSIGFSPDGTHIVSRLGDTIHAWNVVTGKTVDHIDVYCDRFSTLPAKRHRKYVTWKQSDLWIWDGLSYNWSSESWYSDSTWTFHMKDQRKTLELDIDPYGWINSGGNHYIWLSSKMHLYLQHPGRLMISSKGHVEVDFSTGCYGEDWVKSYTPNIM